MRRRVGCNCVSRVAAQSHQRGVRNGPGRLDRVIDRIVEVQTGNKQQRRRLDRSQRGRRIAVEPGCRADIVRIVGPALIDPVERIGCHAARSRDHLVHKARNSGRRHAFECPWFAIGDDTRQRGPGLEAGAVGTGRKTRICRAGSGAQPRSSPLTRAGYAPSAQELRCLRMRSGWLTPHCSACMPPIDAPTIEASRSTPSASSNLRWLATMSRMEKRGNERIGLRLAVAGGSAQPVSDRVGANDEVALRIERPPGTDQKIQPMMGRADRRQDEDDVVISARTGPVHDIADLEIANASPLSSRSSPSARV